MNDQSAQFEATLRREGRTVTLVLAGDLALESIDKFQLALEEAGSDGLDLLVIDLRRLEFLDSSGLRAIVGAEGQALGQGYSLLIVRGNEQVDAVFRVTGLDSTLPIVEEPPAAALD